MVVWLRIQYHCVPDIRNINDYYQIRKKIQFLELYSVFSTNFLQFLTIFCTKIAIKFQKWDIFSTLIVIIYISDVWNTMVLNSKPYDLYLKQICRSTFCQPSKITSYVTPAGRKFLYAQMKLWVKGFLTKSTRGSTIIPRYP